MDYNNYDYNKLVNHLELLQNKYDIFVDYIGKSVAEKNIYIIKLGKGEKNVCYVGSHHSLEWISSSLIMKFVFEILGAYSENKRYLTYNLNDLFKKVTFHIIPMLNPDGVDIVLNGVSDTILKEKLIKWNNGTNFSSNWQANLRGVDLNHNYDAGFEIAKSLEPKYGVFGPSNSRYGGPCPESEPETKALCNYIRQIDFSLLIAYHSQGEVIYYDYNGKIPKNGKKIGKIISKSTGYTLDTPGSISSYGGLKDWFIDKYGKPGYTIELGIGKNPLNFSQFEKIYRDNAESMILAPFLC